MVTGTAPTVIAALIAAAAMILGDCSINAQGYRSVSASTAFLTPIGTTTNILVFSPGGYRFTDYVKVGLPLILLFLAVSLVLVPVIWPL